MSLVALTAIGRERRGTAQPDGSEGHVVGDLLAKLWGGRREPDTMATRATRFVPQWAEAPVNAGVTLILTLLSAHHLICDNSRAEAVLGRTPHGTVQTVDGPVHSLVADRPDAIAETITAWIREHEGTSHPGADINRPAVSAYAGSPKRTS